MDIIAREHPALVLLDVWMPDIDGIELLRRIKAAKPEVPYHDLGPWEYPERRGGDQAGRRRLYRKAVFRRWPARFDRPRAGPRDGRHPQPDGVTTDGQAPQAARAAAAHSGRQRTIKRARWWAGRGFIRGLRPA